MSKASIFCIAIVLFPGIVYLTQAAPQQGPSSTPGASSAHHAVLNQYCVVCHNEKLKTAGLMLDKVDVANVASNAALWEKVLQKVRAGSMPPAGMARPDKAAYDSLATYLETELDRAAAANPNPGRPAVHRLNRAEYVNAIRDLLDLNTDAIDVTSLLPADNAAYGFDNIGDVLGTSPALLERYLSAAEKVSRLAMGDLAIPPALEKIDIPESLKQDERMSDDLPAGSRGGIAINHYFPVEGEYLIRIRLRRDFLGVIVGIADQKQIDVRLDDKRIRLFTVGGEHKGKSNDVAADYDYLSTADAALEAHFTAGAGAHLVQITYLKDTIKPETLPQNGSRAGVGRGSNVDGLDNVTIGGPYHPTELRQTPSRVRILTCHPATKADEEPCARKILSTVARRAYHRPVTDDELVLLLNLYRNGRSGGFEAGIRTALQGILVDPDFLFRAEKDPANSRADSVHPVSDFELASRLSFFLWSSIPDDELLNLAAQGRLKEPAVLEDQVRRMLQDSRSKALVENFAGQWLYLRNLPSKFPDPGVYPNFDENLRQALEQETQLFFDSIIREDRSVVDLLDADYTFVNERLARHYGISNVHGSQFRRVTLHDENRRGLLGQGSILMVTSYATRTAPTLRGKWLLENILGTPPPPPPPNVPSLKEDRNASVLTMRQRMEQHRANPTCASCHKLMDPLGFALENFDAVGGWRTNQGNTPIDASGELPDGTKFQGPSELRRILLSKRDQFVGTVTEKLLTYALGRGIEYYDMPAVRKIVRNAASSDYRFSAIILGIAKSTPFQMRKGS